VGIGEVAAVNNQGVRRESLTDRCHICGAVACGQWQDLH
jgi:hypothetical protein